MQGGVHNTCKQERRDWGRHISLKNGPRTDDKYKTAQHLGWPSNANGGARSGPQYLRASFLHELLRARQDRLTNEVAGGLGRSELRKSLPHIVDLGNACRFLGLGEHPFFSKSNAWTLHLARCTASA